MNARNQQFQLIVDCRQVRDVTLCAFHTILFHRTSGKVRHTSDKDFSFGLLGYEDVHCNELDLTYVRVNSPELVADLDVKVNDFSDAVETVIQSHGYNPATSPSSYGSSSAASSSSAAGGAAAAAGISRQFSSGRSGGGGLPLHSSPGAEGRLYGIESWETLFPAQIKLEFYQKRKRQWPIPGDNVPWEIWELQLDIVRTNNDDFLRMREFVAEKLSDVVLSVCELMNKPQYLPKMPPRGEVGAVLDERFADCNPYLYRVESPHGATLSDASASRGSFMRKLLSHPLAFTQIHIKEMASNMPIILSAAVCKFHDALQAQSGEKELAIVAAYDLDKHGVTSAPEAHASSPSSSTVPWTLPMGASTANASAVSPRAHENAENVASSKSWHRPTIDEVTAMVERCADFQRSCTDRIDLDKYVLHYSVSVATPFSALSEDVVYLCLVENSTGLAHSTFHIDVAQQFLGVLQHSVSSDPTLVHAVSLPILHAQERLQPRFVEIVIKLTFRMRVNAIYPQMTANQAIYADYKRNLAAMSSTSGVSSASTQPSSQITQLQKQMQEVKTIMSDNVVRIMERGERLDNLDSRTEALHASSQNFKTTARRVQRNMCLKNLKCTIILVAFLTVFGGIILYTILYELGVFGGRK